MNTRRGKAWSAEDLKVLADYYPAGGTAEVQMHLIAPRSRQAINEKARRLNITRTDYAGWKRIPTNDQIDAAIRRAYESGVSGEIKRCAHRINRTYGWVKYRAACLGIRKPVKKEPVWSAEEDDLLSEMSGKNLDYIARCFRKAGYRRSLTAIQARVYRLELDTTDPDTHTAADLARLMGLDPHCVLRWINQGLLNAKKGRHMTITDNPQIWRIRRQDIKRFVRDNPQLVDLRKVDKFWFIELLTGSGPQVGARAA